MRLAIWSLLAASAAALAQPALPVRSPEVGADRRVTFRFRAPNAQKVELALEGAERTPMQKDEQGVWSVTSAPLEPDYYGYSIVVDGVALVDPSNPLLKPNLLFTQSMVHVPGQGLPWEIRDVPRGTLHRHFYRSAVVGDDRDYYVYTPPGYAAGKTKYPVLYLLHGFSDNAGGWTDVGRAQVILDNLLADGKVKPMLVVMTLGYGAPEILERRQPGRPDPALWQKNVTKFRQALLEEVIPRVEKDYRINSKRQARAIAGLSMGGAESLYTGLNTLDRFAWIGAFSSGGLGEDYPANFPALNSQANEQLRLLWIACGKQDRLMDANRKFTAWLKSKDVRFTWVETEGSHTWMVWRRNLAEFAPLLFR